MRNRFLTVLASMLSALTACATLNHSPEDTYRYVRSRLGWQIRYGRMELQAAFDGTDVTEPAPNGWEGFLGTKMSNGWTFEEKKEAFDWYLANLVTNDCRRLSLHEQALIYVALDKCDDLCYTNSYMAARGLVLNPNGVHRDKALEVMVKFGPVDDEMTSFIESIATNGAYTSIERFRSVCSYGMRISKCSYTNAVTTRAVQMFNRVKLNDVSLAINCDLVLCDRVPDYATSSNRLVCACQTLSATVKHPSVTEYFISVTNQLFSSGQPLRWVPINEGGGE